MKAGDELDIPVGFDPEFESATFDSETIADEAELQTIVFEALGRIDPDWKSQLTGRVRHCGLAAGRAIPRPGIRAVLTVSGELSPVISRQSNRRPFLSFLPFLGLPTLRIAS